MFKGVRFIISFCNKYNKKFIPLVFIGSTLKCLTPFISIIIPGIILDEILGQARLERLLICRKAYTQIFTRYLMIKE